MCLSLCQVLTLFLWPLGPSIYGPCSYLYMTLIALFSLSFFDLFLNLGLLVATSNITNSFHLSSFVKKVQTLVYNYFCTQTTLSLRVQRSSGHFRTATRAYMAVENEYWKINSKPASTNNKLPMSVCSVYCRWASARVFVMFDPVCLKGYVCVKMDKSLADMNRLHLPPLIYQ